MEKYSGGEEVRERRQGVEYLTYHQKKVEGLPLPTGPRPKGETPKTPKKAYKEKLLKLSAMLIVLTPAIPSRGFENS